MLLCHQTLPSWVPQLPAAKTNRCQGYLFYSKMTGNQKLTKWTWRQRPTSRLVSEIYGPPFWVMTKSPSKLSDFQMPTWTHWLESSRGYLQCWVPYAMRSHSMWFTLCKYEMWYDIKTLNNVSCAHCANPTECFLKKKNCKVLKAGKLSTL